MFSHWRSDNTWTFWHQNGKDQETLAFEPYIDERLHRPHGRFAAGVGIGDLPPVVQPELIRDGRLVKVMPECSFDTVDLSVVHLSNRHISRPVRLFTEFAVQIAVLFPALSV